MARGTRLADGRELTAVELQFLFLEEAEGFAAERGFEDAGHDPARSLNSGETSSRSSKPGIFHFRR